MDISEISTPALIIYLDKVKKNAASMIQRCKEYGVKLRPHFKTTKAVQMAEILSGGSKRGFVVSTLPEAELLAESGFDDILYGIPFGNDPVKSKRCAVLNEKLSEFHVMIDELQKVDIVANLAKNSSKKWSAFISIDCGHHREGILHNLNEVVEMAKRLEENANIIFQGLYAHSGHSYLSKDQKSIHEVADEAVTNLLAVVERLQAIGIECKTYGVGSTPTCSQPSELMRKVTEWHPGNYALNDTQQLMLGSCKEDDIACAVATRVLGHYIGEGRNHLLVDCGFNALTQQGGGRVPSRGFGAVARHPELKLESTTQELGKVTTVDGSPVKFEEFPLGSMLYILPYHSCATCCMHRVYYVADGNGKIVDQWTPASGW